MKKLIFLISIFVLLLFNGNNLLFSANFWKADGAKFVLDHPWLSVEDYAISSDSKILNVKSQSDSLYQFDMETGELLKSFVPSINSISKDWKFSEDGENLIFATFKVNPKKFQNVNHYELDINFYKSNIFDTSIVSHLNYQAFDTNLKKNIEFPGTGYDGKFIYCYNKTNQILKINFQEKLKTPYYYITLYGLCTRGFCFIFQLTNEFLVKKQFLLNGFEKYSILDKNLLYYNGKNHLAYYSTAKGQEYMRGEDSSNYQSIIDLTTLDTLKFTFLNPHQFIKQINDNDYYALYRVDSNSINIQKLSKNTITKQLNISINDIKFLRNIYDHNLILVDKNSIKLTDLFQHEILDSIKISNDSLEFLRFSGNCIVAKNKIQIFKFTNKYFTNYQYLELISPNNVFYTNEEINLHIVSNYKYNIISWSIDDIQDTSLNFRFKLNKSGKYNLQIYCKLANGKDTLINKKLEFVTRLKPDFYVVHKKYKTTENIQFENRSIGENYSLFWDFGDGTISTEYNPIHSYKLKGFYTIKLVIKDKYFSDSIIKDEYVNIDKNESIIVNYKSYMNYNIHYGSDDKHTFSSIRTLSNNYDNNQSFAYTFDANFSNVYFQTSNCNVGFSQYVEDYVFFVSNNDTNRYYNSKIHTNYSNSINTDYLIFDSTSIYKICELEKNNTKSQHIKCESKILWKSFEKKIKAIESTQNDLLVYYTNKQLDCYDMKNQTLIWSSYLDTVEQLIYKSKLFSFNYSLKQFNSDKLINFKVINNSGITTKSFAITPNPQDTIDFITLKKEKILISSHNYISQIQIYNWSNQVLHSNYYDEYTKINNIISYKNYSIISGTRKKYSGFMIIDSTLNEIKSFRIDKMNTKNIFASNGNKIYLFNIITFTISKECRDVYGTTKIYYLQNDNFEIQEILYNLDEYMEIENLSSETEVEIETPIPSTFSIYPNPAQEQLYIQNICKGKLEILNVFGQQVMEFEIKEDETNKLIDLSTLAKGIYLVQTCQGIQKFVKE